MKVILTGATGYIGKRLLPVLLAEGHEVYSIVRDKQRFQHEPTSLIKVIEADLLVEEPITIAADIDVAFYLIHSMGSAIDKFEEMELKSARKFIQTVKSCNTKHIIYLSGLQNPEAASPHLQSRLRVEEMLMNCGIPCTTLRAGIIVGSGSASFEIIRDLAEKLPVMVTPVG